MVWLSMSHKNHPAKRETTLDRTAELAATGVRTEKQTTIGKEQGCRLMKNETAPHPTIGAFCCCCYKACMRAETIWLLHMTVTKEEGVDVEMKWPWLRVCDARRGFLA